MATDYSQDSRPIRVGTPLGKDVLLLEAVVGAEEMSRLFRFELDLLAKETEDIAFDKLLGQPMTVELGDPQKPPARVFHGMVSEFTQGNPVEPTDGPKFTRYSATLVPYTWLLTKTVRSRIFQQKTVKKILEEVIVAPNLKVEFDLTANYFERDYCVQYRESDFDFMQRLMEEEGIFYYFKHESSGHTMMVADKPETHPVLAEPTTVPFVAAGGKPTAGQTGEVVLGWKKKQAIRSGHVILWDYSFQTPEKMDTHLAVGAIPPQTVTAGTVTHKRTAGGGGDLRLYDFPGGYADRFDGVDPGGGDQASKLADITPDGKRTAAMQVQREAWPGLTIEGESDVRRFTAGYKLTLTDHPNADGSYILVRVEHGADITGSYTSGTAVASLYRNQFVAVPAGVAVRPPVRTPKPTIAGPQSAIVVGPAGDEISCDKYGRVKVQFHWDRDWKKNESSSCWVRVLTPWADGQWGMVHVPRIKQEVLVGFEDGDPDKPVILGGTYNAAKMPPYKLPDLATQSGIKTHSTPNGTDETFNELRFEDKKGKEQIYFHAERDFDRVVENNDTLKVGFQTKEKGDQLVHIFNNQDIYVGKGQGEAADGTLTETVWKDRTTLIQTGNEKLTVEKGFRLVDIQTGDETLKVGTGNRLVEIKTGNDTHTITAGNRLVQIDAGKDKLLVMGDREVEIKTGNDKLTLMAGSQTTKVLAGASKTEAMQMIELKVGANSIKIDQTGVTITGILVKIQGQAMVQAKAPIVQLTADGLMMIKGGITMIG